MPIMMRNGTSIMITKNRQCGLLMGLVLFLTCFVASLAFAASTPINLAHTADQINQAHTMSLGLRSFTGIPHIDGQGGLRVGTFTDLMDTPGSYSGAAGWLVQVNGTEDGLELAAMDPLLVAISGLTTGADEGLYFTGVDTVSTFPLTSFARTILDDVDAATVRATIGAVGTSGNETIAGVKTFSSFPVTPSSAPTADYQVANKKYVDDNGGSTTFTGLSDTPPSYTGHAGDYLRVNSTPDGLEFVTPESSTWMHPITKDSPTAATYRWFKAEAALTVTGLDVIEASTDTGSITVDVQECNSSGSSCVSILVSPVTASATGAAATISDTNIASGAWVQIVYGTPSGTVTQVAASLKGTY